MPLLCFFPIYNHLWVIMKHMFLPYHVIHYIYYGFKISYLFALREDTEKLLIIDVGDSTRLPSYGSIRLVEIYRYEMHGQCTIVFRTDSLICPQSGKLCQTVTLCSINLTQISKSHSKQSKVRTFWKLSIHNRSKIIRYKLNNTLFRIIWNIYLRHYLFLSKQRWCMSIVTAWIVLKVQHRYERCFLYII